MITIEIFTPDAVGRMNYTDMSAPSVSSVSCVKLRKQANKQKYFMDPTKVDSVFHNWGIVILEILNFLNKYVF